MAFITGILQCQASLDKSERTLLHKTVRALYPILESETVEPEAGNAGQKNILITHSKQKRKSGI